MDFETFQYKFRDIEGWMLNDDVSIRRKPIAIVNHRTGEEIRFNTLREAWDYEFEPGRTAADALAGIEKFVFVFDERGSAGAP